MALLAGKVDAVVQETEVNTHVELLLLLVTHQTYELIYEKGHQSLYM